MALHVNMFKPDANNPNRKLYKTRIILDSTNVRILNIDGLLNDMEILNIMKEWDADVLDDYFNGDEVVAKKRMSSTSLGMIDTVKMYIICIRPELPKGMDTANMDDKMEYIIDNTSANPQFDALDKEYNYYYYEVGTEIELGRILETYVSGMYKFVVVYVDSDANMSIVSYKTDLELTNGVDTSVIHTHRETKRKITVPKHLVTPEFTSVLTNIGIAKYFEIVDMDMFSDQNMSIFEFKQSFNDSYVDSLAETISVKLGMSNMEGSPRWMLSDVEYVGKKGDEYHGVNHKILAKLNMEIHYKNDILKIGGELEFDIETKEITFIEAHPRGGRVYNVYPLGSNITEKRVYNFDEYFKKSNA